MVLYLLTYVSKIPNTYTTLYVDPYFSSRRKLVLHAGCLFGLLNLFHGVYKSISGVLASCESLKNKRTQ